LQPLDHPDTRAAVEAERAFLAELEAGCQVPIAAYATVDGDALTLDGLVAAVDGSRVYRDRRVGSRGEAAGLGQNLARQLLDAGGKQILDELRDAFDA
jgi:hydroxymethylbilane synthase